MLHYVYCHKLTSNQPLSSNSTFLITASSKSKIRRALSWTRCRGASARSDTKDQVTWWEISFKNLTVRSDDGVGGGCQIGLDYLRYSYGVYALLKCGIF